MPRVAMMVGTTMTSMIATESTRSVALPSPIGPFGSRTAQSQPPSESDPSRTASNATVRRRASDRGGNPVRAPGIENSLARRFAAKLPDFSVAGKTASGLSQVAQSFRDGPTRGALTMRLKREAAVDEVDVPGGERALVRGE